MSLHTGADLRVLLVSDTLNTIAVVERELGRGGFEPTIHRVSTMAALREALSGPAWEVILVDHIFLMCAA